MGPWLTSNATELMRLPIDGRPYDDVPVLSNMGDPSWPNLILIPGGNGDMGKLIDGIPSSKNFLVRSRQAFFKRGVNTYVQFRAGSIEPKAMGTIHRETEAHLQEIKSVIKYIKARSHSPIWIVGTSMGTVSAVNAARNLIEDQVQGFVLTASVVSTAPGNLREVDLSVIKKPVLILHHAADECRYCDPLYVSEIPARLVGSSRVELVMVEGGGPAIGDPCQAMHYHGFVGMEDETVGRIVDWIGKPADSARKPHEGKTEK